MSSASLLLLLPEKDVAEGRESCTDEEESRESQESFEYRRVHRKSKLRHLLTTFKWSWAIHFVLILFNIGFFVLLGERIHDNSTWNVDGKLPYNNPPIRMVSLEIEPGGFHFEPNPVYNTYEGRPDEKNTAAWKRLVEAGSINLDADEYSRFPRESVMIQDGSGRHLVTASVFHQLHCVYLLRSYIWDGQPDVPPSNLSFGINHLDHCLDYLRQVLMCFGDLTPQTYSLGRDGHSAVPDFHEQHQCRDFDMIFEWAITR